MLNTYPTSFSKINRFFENYAAIFLEIYDDFSKNPEGVSKKEFSALMDNVIESSEQFVLNLRSSNMGSLKNRIDILNRQIKLNMK